MSDPEVPRPEQPADVNDVVDSAKAGLADAEAASAEVGVGSTETAASVDPDLAAFEEAEKAHPGTFVAPVTPTDADATVVTPVANDNVTEAYGTTNTYGSTASDADETPTVVAAPYVPGSYSAEPAQVVPSEPVVAPAPVQPIFVQAPEAPRELSNRGTIAGIGLLATLVFAVLYLGTTLGIGAIAGDVTLENIGEAALAPLMTLGFWTPVVVFFIGFWLLGAMINRGRWGLWVVFGLLVGVVAFAGHILGQLLEAPFWALTANEGLELFGEQAFAPLAIAAFIFGRELTIWFGAWAARSGARKTELNAEALREYERTLEAGPALAAR